MFTPSTMGYDRAITIFSPDGKLYQVEYAFEAVRRGWTTIAARGKGGVVLAVEKRKVTPLLDLLSIEKIFKIDDHIGMTFAGLAADGRILIDYARLLAIQHKLTYDEPISVEVLTKKICDIKQSYTQHAGVRPFGVSLLIGGVDDSSPRLFMTEPSGQFMGYYAIAIGSGGQLANEFLEKNYSYDLSLDDLLILLLKALARVIEGELTPSLVEVAVIPVETGVLRKLTPEEIEAFLKKI